MSCQKRRHPAIFYYFAEPETFFEISCYEINVIINIQMETFYQKFNNFDVKQQVNLPIFGKEKKSFKIILFYNILRGQEILVLFPN